MTALIHHGRRIDKDYNSVFYSNEGRGGVVVKALRYNPAGRGFYSRWFHWNFSVT